MSGPASSVARLVAVGEQDTFLTGRPETTFFNTAFYKRHTNFSMFQQEQTLNGNPAAGGTSIVNFPKSGDLLSFCYIIAQIGTESQLISTWSDVIEKAELLIGNQVIDIQDSNFSEEIAVDLLSENMARSYVGSNHGGLGSQSFFYPFRFFFCDKWSSSLPIIALQYSDVRIRITWSSSLNANYRIKFYANYITLDAPERQMLSNKEIDMLIYQVQKQEPSNETTMSLYFNNPVKFIASSNAVTPNGLVDRDGTVKMQVNGIDMLEEVSSVPMYTTIPSYYNTTVSVANAENIFIYPFCLHTAPLQPSGTLNFSRIDDFKIICSNTINRAIYAVNYNILRIKDGMGGLLYAN